MSQVIDQVGNAITSTRQGSGKDVDGGKQCLDTEVCNTAANPVNVTGNFTVAADGPLFPTGDTVTDVSAGFPSVNQVDRAALSIRNISANRSVWVVRTVGISLVAAGVNVWEVGPNETINTELGDGSKIILVAESGKTAAIQILETKG